MPSITVIESFGNRSAEGDELGQRTRSREWKVITTDATLGVDEVLAAIPVRRGEIWISPYGSHDVGCTCRSIEVKERESPYDWLVVAKFSSKPLTSAGGQNSPNSQTPDQTQQENPLLRPVELRYGSVKERKPLVADRDDTAVLNSAGDPFDPPIEIEEVRETITLTWNTTTWVPGTIRRYANHINGTEWHGIPEGQAKCTDLTAELRFEQGLLFWRVTMTVEIWPDDEEGEEWLVKILDAGFREKDPTNPDTAPLVPIRDERTLRPVTKPALLGNGIHLPRNVPPVFLTFRPWDYAEFNALI